MNERKVLLFKKTCYDVGTRFSFIVNGKIVETVISNVMIDYHKNINYEKHSVRYHFCTMDKNTFDEFSERELEDMIHRGIVLGTDIQADTKDKINSFQFECHHF